MCPGELVTAVGDNVSWQQMHEWQVLPWQVLGLPHHHLISSRPMFIN